MKMSRKKIAILVAALLIVAGIVIQAVWRPFAHRKATNAGEVVLDIHHPDAVIDSEALARLPRDMLRVPLLHDVLTQDFVDYYESANTRLSAEGALRRLAFEHQLDWRDELIRRVFDEPAHVLLWRSPDGRLGYWIMSVRRNGLAKLLQGLGNVAASDTQLSQVARLSGDVPVYALKLAVGRTLLFATKDDRLVVLSAPGVLLDEKGGLLGERADAVSDMLSSGRDAAARAYELDALGDAPKGHRLVVSANYLSFGYQAFFSGIDALRFDFSPNGSAPTTWRTSALIEPGKLPQQWNSAALWHALPANAAACASLPADWKEASALLGKVVNGADAAGAIGDRLTGPAAVCWYAKSTLVAPVFIAQVKTQDKTQDAASIVALKTALDKTFGDVIGAYEAKAAKTDANDANYTNYRRLPVTRRDLGADVIVWQRPVSARSGTASSSRASFASQLSAERYFPVTLALAHGYLIFSPDSRLVDDTLAVLDKRYPALADTLAPERLPRTILTLTPSSAAALIEREAGAALPADQEAVFRNASRTHLTPKLRALAHYPPVSLTLPQTLPGSTGWVPVEWWFDRAKGDAGSANDSPQASADQPGTEGD
ncbi:MAG: FIG00458405: hypothetical protein [uncultured Paraburkholderia sp.]|uniref:DUF2138 domain-containing protein n=1 Tax=uncultured Paraburkholderia sp. TaxID=1822466 RepID=UPI002592E262|nr:DUF2138 domain-containing protein [uncultured Paraburkholderia sp.]CAH2898943.1 MAG: FIG00458405: hypothetical protein [uncultured Paraburkholderia sp.]CAH2924449.1 MAG: FIG00458405: hypothetical protein [uncultured Paraburkholderia sp.]